MEACRRFVTHSHLRQALCVIPETLSRRSLNGPAGSIAGILTGGLDKIRAVMQLLEAKGIEFLNHENPGVRLRK